MKPTLVRPMPPAALADFPDLQDSDGDFAPAPDVALWIRAAFLVEDAPLFNPDHQHLESSYLGVLWTNAENRSQGRTAVGTAELPNPKGNAWQRKRALYQLRLWFGEVPDAIITLDAPYCAGASDAAFCALVEHELYHLRQMESDRSGPMFDKVTGRPVLRIQGHDVEEFVGVVRRYGARAAGVEALVEAARQWETMPLVSADGLGHACGTCLARVA